MVRPKVWGSTDEETVFEMKKQLLLFPSVIHEKPNITGESEFNHTESIQLTHSCQESHMLTCAGRAIFVLTADGLTIKESISSGKSISNIQIGRKNKHVYTQITVCILIPQYMCPHTHTHTHIILGDHLLPCHGCLLMFSCQRWSGTMPAQQTLLYVERSSPF
jgi:hypothetical protein